MRTLTAQSAAVFAGLLLLSGCAAHVEQDGATPPSSAPTPNPTVQPAADPATPAGIGEPRVPLDCAGLVPTAVLEDGFMADMAEVPRVAPGSPQSAAVDQAGVLSCGWRGGEPDENGFFGDAVFLSVLVDADFDVPDGEESEDSGFGTRFDTFAEESAIECMGGGGGYGCEVDGTVGRYWFSARIDSARSVSTVEDALEAAERFGESVSASLAGSEPLPAPTAAPGDLPDDCAAIDPDGAVPAAFPEVTLNGPSTPGGDGFGRAAYRAWEQVEFLNCGWHADSIGFLALNALPGGAWAWDPAAIEREAGHDLSGVRLNGADHAASWCTTFAGGSHACTVLFSADGGFFSTVAGHESDGSVALERATRIANAWASAYLD